MTCDWPLDRAALPDPPDGAARRRLDTAVDLATEVLWALTGRQYGACPETLRPDPPRRELLRFDGAGWRPGRCCPATCRATGPAALHLPGPVAGVDAVRIGDAELDPAAYQLEGDVLYRIDGDIWPDQDRFRPLGRPGTWAVTYRRGRPVPDGVGTLVAVLATEFYNAVSGGKNCRLPRRVQNVTRQGISYQMVDPTDIYRAGLTGLPEIDTWIAAVNPHRLTAAPRVR